MKKYPHNWELLAKANYHNKGAVKKMLWKMDNLFKLAEKGDSDAHNIHIDLETALHTEGVLTSKQRKYLLLWMSGYTQQEIAWVHGIDQPAIAITISLGLRNISKYLA